METAELEYRLLKDKCTSVVSDLIKCRMHLTEIPLKESADYIFCLSGSLNNLHDNYLFTAPDYLSVIDHLASDL